MIPVGKHSEDAKPIVLSNLEVCKQLGDCHELVTALKRALVDFSCSDSGKVLINPLRTTIIPNPGSFYMTMPVYYETPSVFSCKMISSVMPTTSLAHSHSGPILNVILALFDTKSGKPLAFMEAEELTAFRTAVVTYLSAKYLTKNLPQMVAVLGTGTQAASHVQVFAALLKPKKITVWGRDFAKSEKFCKQWSDFCCKYGVNLEPALTVQDACHEAHFILTATSSSVPVLTRYAIPGSCRLISIVGAPTKNAQEAETKVLVDCAALYADSREAASTESGDVVNSKRTIDAELGEIICGTKKLYEGPGYVVFKSQGLAVEDAVTAKYVYDRYIGSEHCDNIIYSYYDEM